MKWIFSVLIWLAAISPVALLRAQDSLTNLNNFDVEWKLEKDKATPYLTGVSKQIVEDHRVTDPQDLLPLLSDPDRFAVAHLALHKLLRAEGKISATEWCGLAVHTRNNNAHFDSADMENIRRYWIKRVEEWEKQPIHNDEVNWDGGYIGLTRLLTGKARRISRGQTALNPQELLTMLKEEDRFVVAHVLLTEELLNRGASIRHTSGSWHGLTVHLYRDRVEFEPSEREKLLRYWKPIVAQWASEDAKKSSQITAP